MEIVQFDVSQLQVVSKNKNTCVLLLRPVLLLVLTAYYILHIAYGTVVAPIPIRRTDPVFEF